MNSVKTFTLALCVALVGLASLAPESRADGATEAQVVVDNANRTFTHFMNDPDMVWFRNNLDKAYGLLIIPILGRGGFIIGGSGGRGLLPKTPKPQSKEKL